STCSRRGARARRGGAGPATDTEPPGSAAGTLSVDRPEEGGGAQGPVAGVPGPRAPRSRGAPRSGLRAGAPTRGRRRGTAARRADRNNDAEATGSFADTVIVDSPDEAGMAEEPIEVAVDPRPAIASDASLATRLTDDHTELRRRYIGERFPEVERGAIMLDDP